MKKNLILFILLIAIGSLQAQHDTMIIAPVNAPGEGRVFTIVQVPPKFNGDVNKFLNDHIQYPESAIEDRLGGIVYVRFIVEKNGSLSNITILRGLRADLNKEALRVVGIMPAWSPGFQNGDTVRVQYMLPVRFSLDQVKSPSDSLDKDTSITYEPDVQPKFNGDLEGYLKSHLQYPQSAIDSKIEGKVYITFVVTKTGKVKAATVLRGVDSALDKEALLVISNMPDWIPGTIRNSPVNVQYTLPVSFSLDAPVSNNPDSFKPAPPDSRQAPPPPPAPQDESFCKYTRLGTWIEPHLAIGTSWILLNHGNAINTINGSSGLGFAAGCDIGFMFNDNVGLVTGLQFQQYESKYSSALIYGFPQAAPPPLATAQSAADTSTVSDHSTSVKYTFNYLQVPIMFRYISSDACHTGFHFEGGLLIGYLVGSSESGNVTESVNQWTKEGMGIASFYEYASNSTQTQAPNSTPDASKIDLELVFKMGVLVPLTSSTSLAIDFVPQIKLNNTGDGLKDQVNFGNSAYSYYGPGNYGGGLAFLISVKLLFYSSKQ